MGMQADTWKQVDFICGNHGDEEYPMSIHEGSFHKGSRNDVFYACPNYVSIHVDGHGKRSCNNHFSVKQSMDAIEHLTGVKYKEAGYVRNMTGYVYKARTGIVFTVLRDENEKMKVSVLNERAMRR